MTESVSGFQLEQMAPYVEAIAVDIEALADPNGKYNKHADELREFAQFFRVSLQSCCAMHKFENIAAVQVQLHMTTQNCQCGNEFNHQLLTEVVDIIGKHMNECTKEAVVQQVLSDRRN